MSKPDAGASAPGTDELIEYIRKNPGVLEQFIDKEARRRQAVRGTDHLSLLQVRYAAFEAQESFAAGDIVYWKPGLKNRRRPAYGEPGIIIEVLDPPIFSDTGENSGSAYFREPLGLVVGILDDEQELIVFHFDARRFTKERPQEDA